MKKSLALVLALVMVLSSFSFVSAAPDFADVKGTAYEEPVSRLELLNVLKGYPDGSFKPEGSITRAEFAAVAVRARGLAGVAEAAKGLPSGFVDVPATHWAAGYVGTAGSMGIVNGIGNGMFAPNGLVKYEEAVTMLVRALGYEFEAQAKGGYPYGYLIVAEDIGLLDGARGTQGVFATRGLVAMLTDNALEIPMMIQDGTGKWIVSGEDRTEEVYLLDYMGFEAFEGRVTAYNTSRDTITLRGKNNVTLDVADDFDYYEVNGVTIKAWAKDDMVIVYALKDTVKFDAVEKYDADEFTLVGEDAEYEVNEDAVLKVNGDSKVINDFVTGYADFVKVVLNSDDEIVWAEGYTLEGFILTEEVDEEVIVDLNDEELDVEDFTLVKDGKTIDVANIVAGDIVFYNNAEEFAVVYNNGTEGEITRVYTNDTFRLDGTLYGYWAEAQYLDEEDLATLDADVLDAMMDEESVVEVFVDFWGDVVLVVGDTGFAKTSSFYAVMDAPANIYPGRSGTMVYLDMINQDAEDVDYDLKNSFVLSADFMVPVTSSSGIVASVGLAKDDVVKVTVDEDGDLTKVEKLTPYELGLVSGKDYSFKFDSTYARVTPGAIDYRLLDSTIIFYDLDTTSEKTVTFADMENEFSEVNAGKAYLNSKNQVVVVVADTTDNDDDTSAVRGYVTRVRETSGGLLEVSFADGNRYLSEGDFTDYYTDVTAAETAIKFKVVKLTLGNKSGEIIESAVLADAISLVPTHEVAKVITEVTRTMIKVTGSSIEYKPVSAKFYDLAGTTVTTIGMTDLKIGDTVTLYKAGSTVDEVNFVIRTAKAAGSTPSTLPSGVYNIVSWSTAVDGNNVVNLTVGTEVVGYVYTGSLPAPTSIGNHTITFGTLRGETVVVAVAPYTAP